MPRKIEDVLPLRKLEQERAALEERLKHSKAQIHRLETQLGEQNLIAGAISSAITAAEPFPRVAYKAPSRPGSPVSVAFNYSDWHIGAKVSASQVEGVNAYSWSIAKRRIGYISDKQIGWVETQRNGYRIDEAWVLVLEDMISGGIHDELRTTNEWPEPVQAVNSGLLLGEMILKLAAHFGAVHVIPVGVDNHSRLSKKYQFADAHLNSWCYVVHQVARLYSAKAGNVDYQEAQGIKRLVTIAKHNFLLEHGHTIKGWAGIPLYGISRMRGKEATRRMRFALEEWRIHKGALRKEYGFDYYNIAHFHVPNWFDDDTFVNGALQGTTEFDHAMGRFARPAQIAYLVHPKHGAYNYLPFRTED